jgi:signal transduction histidine kinase
LREHAAELDRANRKLEREIRKRKASEESVRKGKAEYQRLFTESHVLQLKLRRLTRQIISAQEEERKQISRDLHDHVVQNLVGINVHLSALNQEVGPHQSALKQKIARTQQLVETSVNAVHQFARELRPALLDDLGLIPALHSFSKNLVARQKLKIHLTAFSGVEKLDSGKRTALYRVAQEALTNVVRHAGASQATILISSLPGIIRMEVRDDGKSFPVDKTLSARGFRRLGLVGMKERMEMVGGTLTVVSAPGNGTTVCAELPAPTRGSKT